MIIIGQGGGGGLCQRQLVRGRGESKSITNKGTNAKGKNREPNGQGTEREHQQSQHFERACCYCCSLKLECSQLVSRPCSVVPPNANNKVHPQTRKAHVSQSVEVDLFAHVAVGCQWHARNDVVVVPASEVLVLHGSAVVHCRVKDLGQLSVEHPGEMKRRTDNGEIVAAIGYGPYLRELT